MVIKLKVIMDYAKLFGANENEILMPAGTCVRILLQYLEKKYGQPFGDLLYEEGSRELPFRANLFLNGRNILFYEGLGTLLKDGDELFIYPPISGG